MNSVRVLLGTRKVAFVLSGAMRKPRLAMSRITGPVRFAGHYTRIEGVLWGPHWRQNRCSL